MNLPSKEEFRKIFRESQPEMAATMSDADIDRTYEEAQNLLREMTPKQQGKNFKTPTPADTGADDKLDTTERVVTAVFLIVAAYLVKIAYVASATYWFNSVRHLFGIEDKVRARDVYRLMLASRVVYRFAVESGVASYRYENDMHQRIQDVIKGVKTA